MSESHLTCHLQHCLLMPVLCTSPNSTNCGLMFQAQQCHKTRMLVRPCVHDYIFVLSVSVASVAFVAVKQTVAVQSRLVVQCDVHHHRGKFWSLDAKPAVELWAVGSWHADMSASSAAAHAQPAGTASMRRTVAFKQQTHSV